jgi:STE24 endopeptidase
MPQSAPWFTVIFLLALGVSLAMQLWLARRQVQHVAANRAAPPAHFATRITLAAHQKAADYTIARTRLGMLDTVLDDVLAGADPGRRTRGACAPRRPLPVSTLCRTSRVVAVTLLAALVGLPISYRTFVIGNASASTG